MLHKLLLGVEIYGYASVALIATSLLISTIRRLADGKQPSFSYPQDVPIAEAKAAAEGYLHRSLVALDIFMNVVLFRGEQGMTMSTHAWRSAQAGKLWGKAMNWWLNGFQAAHGPQAASGDLERAVALTQVLVKALDIKS